MDIKKIFLLIFVIYVVYYVVQIALELLKNINSKRPKSNTNVINLNEVETHQRVPAKQQLTKDELKNDAINVENIFGIQHIEDNALVGDFDSDYYEQLTIPVDDYLNSLKK